MDERFNRTESNDRLNDRMSDRSSRLSRLFNDDFSNQSSSNQPNNDGVGIMPQRPNVSNPSLIVKNPKSYEDVRVLIDHLKKGEQVLINFKDVNQNIVCRILDFMSGAVYALNGSIQEVEKNLFVFAPQGVTIYMNK